MTCHGHLSGCQVLHKDQEKPALSKRAGRRVMQETLADKNLALGISSYLKKNSFIEV